MDDRDNCDPNLGVRMIVEQEIYKKLCRNLGANPDWKEYYKLLKEEEAFLKHLEAGCINCTHIPSYLRNKE